MTERTVSVLFSHLIFIWLLLRLRHRQVPESLCFRVVRPCVRPFTLISPAWMDTS